MVPEIDARVSLPVVMGVDPGYSTGWAVVRGTELLDHGVIEPPRAELRRGEFDEAVLALAEVVTTHRPEHAAVEHAMASGGTYRHARSEEGLAGLNLNVRLPSAIADALSSRGVSVVRVNPATWHGGLRIADAWRDLAPWFNPAASNGITTHEIDAACMATWLTRELWRRLFGAAPEPKKQPGPKRRIVRTPMPPRIVGRSGMTVGEYLESKKMGGAA